MIRPTVSPKSCALDPRAAGSSLAGQLLIFFHNVFSVLTKTLCRHSSLVPRSRIKAFMRSPRCYLPDCVLPPPPPPPPRLKIMFTLFSLCAYVLFHLSWTTLNFNRSHLGMISSYVTGVFIALAWFSLDRNAIVKSPGENRFWFTENVLVKI